MHLGLQFHYLTAHDWLDDCSTWPLKWSVKRRQQHGYRPQSQAWPAAGCWRGSGASSSDTVDASRSKRPARPNSQTKQCQWNTNDLPAWFDNASLCLQLLKQHDNHTTRFLFCPNLRTEMSKSSYPSVKQFMFGTKWHIYTFTSFTNVSDTDSRQCFFSKSNPTIN